MSSAGTPEESLPYQNGFGNEFETEALPGALPRGQNNPLQCPYDLYAEQLSGTAFTKPRTSNLRTWLYRIRPSVSGYEKTGGDAAPYTACEKPEWFGHFNPEQDSLVIDPNPLRWDPLPLPNEERSVTFIEGTHTISSSGNVETKSGLAVHMYTFNRNMSPDGLSMYNSDGDFLFVPQAGDLIVKTEMGSLEVGVGEICALPRGVVFAIDMAGRSADGETGGAARGYILEIYKGHLELPDLGPIGSNGLANPRDFQYPTAAFDHSDDDSDSTRTHLVMNKFCNKLFVREQNHTPYNVVAWHGNYAPFKYDLSKFCCMNSVTYDHPDPSIYTVLTAKSDDAGTSLADFVIFPHRWMVMEHTFRPPYFHRNCMSEFMGMIYGTYDAKGGDGFRPGGASLHNCMTPHGPDAETVGKEARRIDRENVPVKFDGGLAFMFETSHVLKLTEGALNAKHRDLDYTRCWNGIPCQFHPADKKT